MGTTALQDAQHAMRLAGSDPRSALDVAGAAARRARRERDAEAVAIAERALGFALLHCADLRGANRHLRRSIEWGLRAGSATLAGEARMTLAYALVHQGRQHAALAEIDEAIRELDGVAQARARAYRGIVLRLVSREAEALAELNAAVAVARAAGDRLVVHRMLINRALVHVNLNALDLADADLLEAQEIAEEFDQRVTLGLVAENRGFVATLRGDVPAALAHLGRAEQIITAHAELSGFYRDRAALLLSVGLVSEARRDMQRGIAAYRRQGRWHMVPEIRLMLAEAAHLDRDWTEAIRQARLAAREFGRQDRNDRVERARLEVLRAQLAAGVRPRVPTAAVEAMVDTMAWSESPAVAVEARLVAAKVAAIRGQHAAWAGHLRRARRIASRGAAMVRARGWYAEALLREGSGNPRGVIRAAQAGLRLLTDHSAALGAADLRAHYAAHRVELALLGLRTALGTGAARDVFEWAELGRASQLLHPPVRPPPDPELAALLAQLRATVRQLDSADAGSAAALTLRRSQAALERQIRDRIRQRPGQSGTDAAAPVPAPVSPVLLGRALGEVALVEYIQLDGQLFALTLVDGRLRLHELGPVAPVAALIERLPFALNRLARPGSTATKAAALMLLHDTASRLDTALLRPLADLDSRPLLMVPTKPIHGLPWAVLPSCAGRPVAVSPSATLWHTSTTAPAATRHGAPARRVGVAAGPRLPGAREEAVAVAAVHNVAALTGGAATVNAVLELLATADLVHLAAHGRLSVDNPLFSDLRLADGPLVVHDVEHLPKVPRTLVLAACDSARSVVHVGDELLGLSAAFIAQGTAQLVATVVPIPDAETAPLMIAFHRHLTAGSAPAAALAAAQTELGDAGPAALAAAAGFVCLGS